MSDLLSHVRIVLVETSHPGNVGAVARAMKTMSLKRLYLVKPKRFPSADATARAAGADDLLYEAAQCGDLSEALADCTWVVGTSARSRSLRWPELSPRSLGRELQTQATPGEVAVVFGREHSGLTNAELDHCNAVVKIPTDPEYRSLNLAGAVQVIAYEILAASRASDAPAVAGDDADPSASAEDMEGLYGHLEGALQTIGYLDPDHPRRLMRRLRRMFNRMGPTRSELNILRGMLAAAEKAARR